MGDITRSKDAGKYITHVDISVRQWTSGRNEALMMCDVKSNLPIEMAMDYMPDKTEVYALSFVLSPRSEVYVETGDLSLVLAHCCDNVGCFICSTPTTFRIMQPDKEPIVGLCLEYLSSFFEFVRIEDQPIHIVTEHEEKS